MKMKIVAISAALIAVSAAAPAFAVSIANPSFELTDSSLDPNAAFVTAGPGQLPGWTVTGSVDQIFTYWQAQSGARSIDLNGNGAGSIEQTLTGLTAGTQYLVSFFVSGNPDNRAVNPKTATLTLGSASNLVSYSLTAANNTNNMLWQQVSYSFTADNSGSALLRLASNSNDAYGLAVDNFSIAAVPEPATWAMMIVGFGIAGVAVRRRRPERTSLPA
jgi:choice-of-anchor C domain-containing protein